MNYINTNRSGNNSSPFALIWVVFVIGFIVITGIYGDSIGFMLFFIALTIFPILFALDIFLWCNIGKEIIYTQNEILIIKKTNRIFPRKKKIRFKNIEDIYLWESKGFFNELFRFPFEPLDLDDKKLRTICVKYDNGCKYYIGRHLDKAEAEELLKMLKLEITPAEPDAKSKKRAKISDRIVLTIAILLIIFFIISIFI